MSPTDHQPSARFSKDQPMHTSSPAAATSLGSAGGSRRHFPARTVTALVMLAAAAAAATLSLTAAPALADSCLNATLRAQNDSTQLPDCRAYELVSPPFKQGFLANPNAPGADGKLAYASNGNFAGNGNGAGGIQGANQYIAIRSSNGWTTTALAPSGPDYNASPTDSTTAKAFSPDLRSSVWLMSRIEQPSLEQDLYLRTAGGAFRRIGPGINPDVLPPSAPGGESLADPPPQSIGASDDLSHVVFSQRGSAPWPGAVVNYDENLWEYVGTDNERPRLVGVDNGGNQINPGCQSVIGDSPARSAQPMTAYRAMSTDGRVIFWTSICGGQQLFARISDTTTIAVSSSQCTRASNDPGGFCNATAPATFQGANASGTRVYFTTSQQLVDADINDSNDLYECVIPAGTPAPVGLANPCPGLREVTGAAGAANVQGVIRISDDGSRVYFVATGVLASNHGANDEAAAGGDDNLYVWQRDAAHPDGQTTFVAKLDPADGGLWSTETQGAARQAETTDNGRYLLLNSYAPLIDHGPQVDTDTAHDLYRYDANDGALTRVSTGADGEGGNTDGADPTASTSQYIAPVPTGGPRRVMTDDGQTIAFNTTEALSPADTNGTRDAYVWHDGRVSLVSSGKPSLDGEILATYSTWLSPSGRDLYFQTTARLTANDVDTQADIYDARVDGGFDLSTPQPCAGDACQGESAAPPPASPPGSTLATGQGGAPQVTPAFAVRALTAAQGKQAASTGKLSLAVTTNTPGTLSATATADIARRPSIVGTAKRVVAGPGTVSLSLILSKRARAALKSTGKLSVKVMVRQSNVAVARRVSLKLTRARAVKKKPARTASRRAAVKRGRS